MADVTLGAPVNGMIEIAGPEPIRLDELVRRFLSANRDARTVITDVHARYFGTELDDQSLTPGDNPASARLVSRTGSAAPYLRGKPSGRVNMMITEKNRATSMVVFIMVALNGLFLFGNGLIMLVVPSAWYHFVPGVTHTGSFNQHFIRDIGLIQMFLGAAFGIGAIRPASRLELWAAATSWLIAHAVLHLWEVAVGMSSPSVIARDFPAVTLPALIGIALTAWAWRSRPSKVRHAEQSAAEFWR